MLNADSSALNSDSDDQSRNSPPTIPSVAAFAWIARTTFRIVASELDGNALFSSRTKKSDASARPARPSSASVRKTSGMNERSAKYAIIAARCVPRSAKNFPSGPRMGREYGHGPGGGAGPAPGLPCGPGGRVQGPGRPDGDLDRDRGRRDRAAIGRD